MLGIAAFALGQFAPLGQVLGQASPGAPSSNATNQVTPRTLSRLLLVAAALTIHPDPVLRYTRAAAASPAASGWPASSAIRAGSGRLGGTFWSARTRRISVLRVWMSRAVM